MFLMWFARKECIPNSRRWSGSFPLGLAWVGLLITWCYTYTYLYYLIPNSRKPTKKNTMAATDWAASKSVTAMAPAPMGWSWYPLGVLQGFSSGHKAWILDSHYLLISLVQIWVNWREQTTDFDLVLSLSTVSSGFCLEFHMERQQVFELHNLCFPRKIIGLLALYDIMDVLMLWFSSRCWDI